MYKGQKILFLPSLAFLYSATAIAAGPPFVPGQVVIKGDSFDLPEYEVVKHLPRSGLTVLGVPKGKERAAIMKLRGKKRWATRNLIARKSATDDPLRSYQWHFDNIQADAAWNIATGSGVTVAVLDTGLATKKASDGVNSCGGTNIINPRRPPVDGDGHGTHVSGTIAQNTNNGTGVAGLAHGACVMPVKVLDDTGSGTFADIAEGIYYAVDNGADVINMSLGIDARYHITNDAIMDPALNYAENNDVVVVAASGNDGYAANVSYPAIYPSVIAVGATDARDEVTPYSNKGTGLDMVAPGGDTSRDDTGDSYGDGVLQETYITGAWGYYFFNGTSMASPHVAAVAALLKSHGVPPADIRETLQSSAKDLGDPDYDSSYGFGLVQAEDALNATASNSPPNASFTYACTELNCSFDASGSTDTDGIASYGWVFGDGNSGSGVMVDYSYGSAGNYTVTLTVADTLGATNSQSQDISVTTGTTEECTDSDGDGFCANLEPIDCDDNNADAYPGFNEKGRRKSDDVDNDCNGIIDG